MNVPPSFFCCGQLTQVTPQNPERFAPACPMEPMDISRYQPFNIMPNKRLRSISPLFSLSQISSVGLFRQFNLLLSRILTQMFDGPSSI